MHGARIAIAALASIGCGILLGLAANPTMRPMPGSDWRERYRASTPAPPPPPQPGVSYYGDGSTAWAWGGAPVRINDSLPPLRVPQWRDEPEEWTPTSPPPELPREDYDVQVAAAERAEAQAVVSRALARTEVRAASPEDADPPADAMAVVEGAAAPVAEN